MFSPIQFVLTAPLQLGAGFVVGAFTPKIGRTIKSWFVKEASTVKTDIAKKL